MQSFQSLRGARWGTNGRNPEDGRDFTILTTAQQVLRVVLLFPVLGRKILLPSRKGAWDRMRKGLVPLSAGGRPDKGFLEHPHRIWMYLDNGGNALNPRKHTIVVRVR